MTTLRAQLPWRLMVRSWACFNPYHGGRYAVWSTWSQYATAEEANSQKARFDLDPSQSSVVIHEDEYPLFCLIRRIA